MKIVSGHRPLTVVQDPEVIRGRVSGAILTRGLVTIELLNHDPIEFRVRGTQLETDGKISLVEGVTTDGKHLTIHLHETGEVTALLDDL